MATTLPKGIKISFSNTPQAHDDSFSFLEGVEGSIQYLNVLANDSGGAAKSLYSLDDGTNADGSANGSTTSDLLRQDAVGATGTSALGATIWIVADGTVAYNTLTLGDLDYLAEGETLTDTFTYAIRLGNGAISWATAMVTITGSNDAPTISLVEAGAVTEDAGNPMLTDSGAITFDDLDLTDTHTTSVVAIAGNTLGGAMSVAVTDVATAAGDGTVTWDYSLANSATQHLGAGESASEQFTVTIADNHGGTVGQIVTVTTAGVNDAPVVQALVGDNAGANLTETDSGLTASGKLSAIDVDLTNTVTMSVASVSAVGDIGTLTNAQLMSFLQVVAGPLAANPGDSHNVDWTFSSGTEAFNYLLEGEELTVTYTVRATDDSGAANNTGDQVVSIHITGTSDAEPPNVQITVLDRQADDPVNLVRLLITADQTASDGSNYIDRLVLGSTPSDVDVDLPLLSLDPAGEPNHLVREVDLLLPTDHDSAFDFSVTAFAREDGAVSTEEAASTATQHVALDVNTNAPIHETFNAVNQSIWNTGAETVIHDVDFVGIGDEDGPNVREAHDTDGLLRYDFRSELKAGLQTTVHFEGGDIDATLGYDITINTAYSETTDTLQISPDAALTSGAFNTEGPSGYFLLDFVFHALMDLEVKRAALVGDDKTLFHIDIGPIDKTVNILEFTSDDPPIELDLAAFPGFSVILEWPHVNAIGSGSSPPPGEFSSPSAASNNFFTLNFDVDEFAMMALGIPPEENPFDIHLTSEGENPDDPDGLLQYDIHAELLDIDLFGGFNLIQKFVMQEQDLSGLVQFEDGSTEVMNLGQGLVIENASSRDLNNDGHIGFQLLGLVPTVTLHNDTDLGVNVGFNLDLLKLSGTTGRDEDPFLLGPVIDLGGDLPIAAINLVDRTFDLNFETSSNSYLFVA